MKTAAGAMIRWLILVLFVEVCQGKIKSFSVSRLDNVASKCLKEGNYVVLECEINDESSTIEIKRLQDGAIVNMSRVGEKSLRHVIYGVSCSDMGTYECIRDHVERQTADLVILHCPLQPCDGADVQRTIFVEVKEKISVSLCVLACENIGDSNAMFNGTTVTRKNNESSWYWDYEKLESAGLPTSRFHVHVHGHVKFGMLNVRIFSRHGRQYYLDLNITLTPPGPPDCPTEVNITDREHGSVELSWKPGLDGGAKQRYAVYYSKDGVDWSIHRDGIEQTSENLTELDSNTTYYFRVASWNQHSGQVNASTCNNTVFVLTSESVAKSDDVYDNTRADILVPILCVCSILILIILVSAILCWKRKVNGKRLNNTSQRNEKSPMVTTQNNKSTSPGDYVSDDGLKYISVYPVDEKRKEKRKRRARETKVQYATLDFIKTEKLRQHPVAL